MTIRFNPHQSRLMAEPADLPKEFRVSFVASYAYSPKGSNDLSRQSRLLCARVKAGDRRCLRRCVGCLRQQMLLYRGFAEQFGPGSVLIPVPPSDCSVPVCLWPTRHLASAIERAGLAACVWTGLSRLSTVDR